MSDKGCSNQSINMAGLLLLPLQAVDGALPPRLLLHMQTAFAPSSPFWSEHHYGRVGYFSYMHALVGGRVQPGDGCCCLAHVGRTAINQHTCHA